MDLDSLIAELENLRTRLPGNTQVFCLGQSYARAPVVAALKADSKTELFVPIVLLVRE